MKELTAYDRYQERQRIAEEQHIERALFQAQNAAIGLAHKVKMYEDALGEIAWSNNSEWQQDRAKQVLAQMRGGGVMKPEPIAWVYQNANTEHQYLVWHKQEGGRNWTPLFTLQDVQDAILAEREAIARSLDKQAGLAGDQMDRKWAQEMAAAVRARGQNL